LGKWVNNIHRFIEDGMAEDDWDGWKFLIKTGDKCQLWVMTACNKRNKIARGLIKGSPMHCW
jgi:enolase